MNCPYGKRPRLVSQHAPIIPCYETAAPPNPVIPAEAGIQGPGRTYAFPVGARPSGRTNRCPGRMAIRREGSAPTGRVRLRSAAMRRPELRPTPSFPRRRESKALAVSAHLLVGARPSGRTNQCRGRMAIRREGSAPTGRVRLRQRDRAPARTPPPVIPAEAGIHGPSRIRAFSCRSPALRANRPMHWPDGNSPRGLGSYRAGGAPSLHRRCLRDGCAGLKRCLQMT